MNIPQYVFDEINEAVAKVFEDELILSRRNLLRDGMATVAVFALPNLACKTVGTSGTLNTPNGSPDTFMSDIRKAEIVTPVTASAATDLANFKAQATLRGQAVAGVIKKWLKADPKGMFTQLQSADFKDPFFSSKVLTAGLSIAVGPVIFFRNEHVRDCLASTSIYNVTPYSSQMFIGTDAKYDSNKMGHFILGTDDDTLYRIDDRILRSVLVPADRALLHKITRASSEAVTDQVKKATVGGQGKIDIVATLGSIVPIDLIDKYMGVHVFAAGQKGLDGAVEGGKTFPITADLNPVFKFPDLKEGTTPTSETMFAWIKDAFRNIFNNLDGDPTFRARGALATQQLSLWIQRLLVYYKGLLTANASDPKVPDTMLTRLIKLQMEANGANGAQLAQKYQTTLADLQERLSDGRIRSNVFGTVVGAATNPNEAMTRIAHGMLELKNQKIGSVSGSTYDDAVKAALSNDTNDETQRIETLRRFVLEALRIYPQGQLVVRSVAKTTSVSSVAIQQGSFVFAAHGPAMVDETYIPNANAFDITRDQKLMAYDAIVQPKEPQLVGDRPNEEQQSSVYLHHGYGRHKCLGRYASEITMTECLRALLRLGDISRDIDNPNYVQDDKRIYVTKFDVDFTVRP